MLLAGILSGVALYLLWPLLGTPRDLGASLAGLGLNPLSWLPFILYFSLVNPWLEELYWRGWLGSLSPSLLARDIWFGGYHVLVLAPYVAWQWLALPLLSLSAAGWFWRQIARRKDSLLAGVLFHLAADAAILVAIYLRVS